MHKRGKSRVRSEAGAPGWWYHPHCFDTLLLTYIVPQQYLSLCFCVEFGYILKRKDPKISK